MTNETSKKRRKEAAWREQGQKKEARLTERRNERQKTGNKLQEKDPKTAGSVFGLKPKGNATYFASAARPRDPKKKSEITLYNVGTGKGSDVPSHQYQFNETFPPGKEQRSGLV